MQINKRNEMLKAYADENVDKFFDVDCIKQHILKPNAAKYARTT